MNTAYVLSIIAIGLTIINTFLVINSCIINKKVNVTLELIIISLLIAIIWSVYGYIENHQHMFTGNIIIILLLSFLLYLYCKYS